MEFLVDHIDMLADDAMQYIKLLQSHEGLKVYNMFITNKVSE